MNEFDEHMFRVGWCAALVAIDKSGIINMRKKVERKTAFLALQSHEMINKVIAERNKRLGLDQISGHT